MMSTSGPLLCGTSHLSPPDAMQASTVSSASRSAFTSLSFSAGRPEGSPIAMCERSSLSSHSMSAPSPSDADAEKMGATCCREGHTSCSQS